MESYDHHLPHSSRRTPCLRRRGRRSPRAARARHGRSTIRVSFPRSRSGRCRIPGRFHRSPRARGQRQSFRSYGDVETAADILALVEDLGGPAVVAGNSMGAGSAALAAAERPDLVRGLVLIGPFLRNGSVSAPQRILLRIAMFPLWAAASWKMYLPKLYAGRRPTDFEAYRDRVVASLRRPGYAKAFSLTTRTSHAPVEARLDGVSAPTLVVMGEQDPDFPDPQRGGRLDRRSLAGRRRHGARGGALPAVTAARRHQCCGAAVSGKDS